MESSPLAVALPLSSPKRELESDSTIDQQPLKKVRWMMASLKRPGGEDAT